jgi:hypothetical protein
MTAMTAIVAAPACVVGRVFCKEDRVVQATRWWGVKSTRAGFIKHDHRNLVLSAYPQPLAAARNWHSSRENRSIRMMPLVLLTGFTCIASQCGHDFRTVPRRNQASENARKFYQRKRRRTATFEFLDEPSESLSGAALRSCRRRDDQMGIRSVTSMTWWLGIPLRRFKMNSRRSTEARTKTQ